MIKRKDLLKTAFNSDTAQDAASMPDRVPAGAVRAMGLSLGRIGEDAAKAEALEDQISRGDLIHELDPELVEPSFVEDRLARTADAKFRQLVDSIRSVGQQVPILVRPKPGRPGYYQVAYGHRRVNACLELAKTVKAIIRTLSDDELVLAQGKENSERHDLSFIERAQFAARLEQRGFERATIQSALAVHPAELTRFLAVSRDIPVDVLKAIGPSPRAGRPRWMELAKLLAGPNGGRLIGELVGQHTFERLSSDARFDLALQKLRHASPPNEEDLTIFDKAGRPVIRTERRTTTLRIMVDLKLAPGLDTHLLALLPGIFADFSPE